MAETTRVATATRIPPRGAAALVSVAMVPHLTRLTFRGSLEAADACAKAFDCGLPWDACRATESGAHAALWLGPDEWLLLAPETGTGDLFRRIEDALATVPHALVDISHRQIGFAIAGASAADLLNSGCPLDLDLASFPVGMCTRTVLAKCDIVLWRRAPDVFRLEVNRSFADYVARYLKVAERGID